jgi:hypothetical protein
MEVLGARCISRNMGHEISIVPIQEMVAINIKYGKNIFSYVTYMELNKIRFKLKDNLFIFI